MSGQHSGDARRANLRALVGEMDSAIAHLPAADGGLRRSWAEMVKVLDLGSSPSMRACPICDKPCMSAATRCGSCWAKLVPLDAPLVRA